MEFKPIQPIRLYEQVVERISEMAESGAITPGNKFPPERELMKQFGVSRQVLREAFSVLETQRWVATTPGGGRVYLGRTSTDSEMLVQNLQSAALLEILVAREAVETSIASLAAQNATASEIAQLKRQIDNLGTDGYTFNWNFEFHLAIAKTARNTVLHHLLELLLQIRRETYAQDYLSQDQLQRLFQDHLAIVEAIESRDSERAASTMRQHIRDTRDAYRERVKRLGKRKES
jgi:GntR family transcriptional repressor for pyruvate dehydrogenase complex